MNTERSFGGGERVPYVPQYGNADFSLICKEAGLDPAIYATQEFLITRAGIGALWELLSDGEIIVQPRNKPFVLGSANPELRHGEFYTKMASLLQRADQQPGSKLDNELNKMARFCGIAYAHEVASGTLPSLGTSSEVHAAINPQGELNIEYAGYRIRLSSPSVIMDIGPGIAGRQFIELQAQLLIQDKIIQYLAISKGPFINQFLIESGREIFNRNPQLPHDFFKELVNRHFFIGREDGIAAALEEILSTPQPSGQHDFVDTVICNGLGEANREELAEGLNLVPSVMKPGGYFLLGLPSEKLTEENLGFDEAFQLIADRFVTVHQVTKRSGSALLGRATTSTYAVLQQRAA